MLFSVSSVFKSLKQENFKLWATVWVLGLSLTMRSRVNSWFVTVPDFTANVSAAKTAEKDN